MRRAFDLLLSVAVLAAGACLMALLSERCPRSIACMGAGASMHGATMTSRVVELSALAGAGLVIGRTLWILKVTARTCAALVTVANPPALASAVARTGIRRVRCVESAPVPAFCHGIRPTVVIEVAVPAALSAAALDAVLLHEEAHCRHRDPLRRALREAVVDVACRSGVLRWWSERAKVREELRADAWAERRVGTSALASALLSLAPPSDMTSVPAFGDAADARVTQLLGERPRLPQLPAAALLRSGLAAIAVLVIAICAAMSSF